MMHKTNRSKMKTSLSVNMIISKESIKSCKYIIHLKQKHYQQQAQIITLLKIQLTCVYGCVCILPCKKTPGKENNPCFLNASVTVIINHMSSWKDRLALSVLAFELFQAFYFLTLLLFSKNTKRKNLDEPVRAHKEKHESQSELRCMY